jgi:hypothetical protein
MKGGADDPGDPFAERKRNEYLALRRRYEPESIRLAESPPASGKYFYNAAHKPQDRQGARHRASHEHPPARHARIGRPDGRYLMVLLLGDSILNEMM